MTTKYVIESRDESGTILLSGPQPRELFGNAAIDGINEDAMARIIYRKVGPEPKILLTGMNVRDWPRNIHPTWVARVKYW